jgi:hypothetical protein
MFGTQFTKFIAVLATPIFNVHIACPTNHSKLLQELIAPDLQCAVMCQRGVNSSVRLACALSYFAGGSAYDLWNLTHILVWTVCDMLLRW